MARRAWPLALLLVLLAAGPAAARVKPVAALSGPAVIKAGTKATFDASSSTHDPAGKLVEYAWDLDGSGTFDDVRKGPTITTLMDVPGEVTVSVRVTDDAGATSIATGHFLVEGVPPTARIAVPSPVVAGQPVTLDASASTSDSGDIVAYAWDVDGTGFGADTAEPTLTTVFPTPGTVTIGLRVRDSASGERVLRQAIEVVAPGAEAPAALGGSPEQGVAPLDLQAARWIRVGSDKHFAAINGAARRGLRTVRGGGLWVNLLADRAARFRLDVLVSRQGARRLGLRGKAVGRWVRVARVSTRLPVAGQRPFRVVLPRAVRRALRKPVTLFVRGTATDAGGHRSAVSRAFALRR
ncbi:MAG: hypothetical protein JWM73_2506 [Solirubrobacterales bacterium]|nr:hypothetical protein [Solirubrobacterales bacterium]